MLVLVWCWRVDFERARIILFAACRSFDAPREKMSNHCRGNKKEKEAFVFDASYLSLSTVMDDNLGVECVCLSIAAVQSDQGQAPTEKGPVPQLMSSIIQMESLLSVRSALVRTHCCHRQDRPVHRFLILMLYQFTLSPISLSLEWNAWGEKGDLETVDKYWFCRLYVHSSEGCAFCSII